MRLGVSCSFSIVNGSSASTKRRMRSVTDKSLFTRSTARSGGIKTLRIPARDVLTELDAVMRLILSELAACGNAPSTTR